MASSDLGGEVSVQQLPLVSVVVVNFNGRALLGDTLASLEAQSYPCREVILVDNGSADGSAEFVRSTYRDVRVVSLPTNHGFAAGCNAGIETACGPLIATLNNDAVADRSWLDELVQVLIRRPDVGMVASKMLRASAPAIVDSAGIAVDQTGLAWDRHGGEPDAPEPEQEVFGPCAGAALYRRAIFEDVGLFDQDFFCYLEDVDLAWRARLAGWRCLYAPRARVYHRHSATAGEGSPFKRYYLSRNKVWLIVKNYPSPWFWVYLPAIVLYDLAALLRAIARPEQGIRRLSLGRPEVRARIDAVKGLADAWHKRRLIQKQRRVSSRSLLAFLDGPSWPWQVAARYRHLQASASRR